MIDMNQIAAYLVPSIVILCYLVGYILKNLIPTEKVDRFIPLIVGIVGVAAAVGIAVSTGAPVTVDIIIGGLVSGLASTGAQNLFKQLATGGKEDEDVISIPKGEDTTQFVSTSAADAEDVQEDTQEYQSKHMRAD